MARSKKKQFRKFHICIHYKRYGKLHGARSIDTPFNSRYALGHVPSSNGISPFLIGTTPSIRVHFPASYVRLDYRSIYLLPNMDGIILGINGIILGIYVRFQGVYIHFPAFLVFHTTKQLSWRSTRRSLPFMASSFNKAKIGLVNIG